MLPLDDGRERACVIRGRDNAADRERAVGMSVVGEKLLREACEQTRRFFLPDRVPSDVGAFDGTGKPGAVSGEYAQAGLAGAFFTTFKEPLHSEADAKKPPPALDSRSDCCGQLFRACLAYRRY